MQVQLHDFVLLDSNLIQASKHPQASSLTIVWCIGNIAGDGPENRDMTLAAGLLQPLLTMLNSPIKLERKRNATWVLSTSAAARTHSPNLRRCAMPFPPWSSSSPTRTSTRWSTPSGRISYLTDGDNKKIQAMIDDGAAPRLVEMLSRPVVKLQMPAICSLGNIATGDNHQTQVGRPPSAASHSRLADGGQGHLALSSPAGPLAT